MNTSTPWYNMYNAIFLRSLMVSVDTMLYIFMYVCIYIHIYVCVIMWAYVCVNDKNISGTNRKTEKKQNTCLKSPGWSCPQLGISAIYDEWAQDQYTALFDLDIMLTVLVQLQELLGVLTRHARKHLQKGLWLGSASLLMVQSCWN